MKELDQSSLIEQAGPVGVLTLKPGPKTEGGRNTYCLELLEVPKNSAFALVDHEGKPLGTVAIRHLWDQIEIDCERCPKLKPVDKATRLMDINPYAGHARQKINDEDTLIIHGDCLRYKPLYLSRKRSSRNNKYGKWLAATRRDRHPGFVK